MADNNPNVPGGVPPKPAEAAKVQPKKETVRISLPPKPTSSPTIKLPTIPAGGPASPAGAPAAGVAAPPAPGVVRPPTSAGSSTAAPMSVAPATRPPTSTGPAVARPAGMAAPAGVSRPAAPAAVKKVSGLDVGLAIVAAVVGLGAAVSMALLLNLK